MIPKSKEQQVWEKAKPIRGEDPDAWRRDSYGNKIRRESYGTLGQYGWELDHKKPRSNGGSNDLSNLQPLHWKKNRDLGDKKG